VLFARIGGRAIWLHMPAAGIITALLFPLFALFIRKAETSFPLLLDAKPGGMALAFSVERDAGKASEASAAVGDFCEEQGFDVKKTMLLSLAIEELVAIIAGQNKDGGDISIRLTSFEGGTVLRLRDTGKKFNPIEYYTKRLNSGGDIEELIGLMGIKYIAEAAAVVYYRETFGINNLVVIL